MSREKSSKLIPKQTDRGSDLGEPLTNLNICTSPCGPHENQFKQVPDKRNEFGALAEHISLHQPQTSSASCLNALLHCITITHFYIYIFEPCIFSLIILTQKITE